MKVCIIIPTYNAEPFLEEAINSALQQGDCVAEIIIVDNNSTDHTLEIAKSLAKNHPDLIRVLQETQQGCSQARNKGIANTNAAWIQFLDADDLIAGTKLASQCQLIEADTDWIIAGYTHQYANGDTEVSIPHEDPWKGLVHNFAIGNTCANLYRKAALVKVGGWPEHLPDNTDHHLHFNLLKIGAAYKIDPSPQATYRHFNQERVSTRQPLSRMERKVQFHLAVNDHLKTQKPDYWLKHQAYFDAALVRALRMLATLDVTLANQYFGQYFQGGLPVLDHRIISRFTHLYSLLGFQRTERLRILFAKSIPHRLKEKIKAFFRTA